MERNQKIIALWLMTICGFACHSLTDILPMFWGKDMAVVATNGNVDYGMIVFMMTLSFFIPACGMFCMLTDCHAKLLRTVNGCPHRTFQHCPCVYGTAFRKCRTVCNSAYDDSYRLRISMALD